MFEEQIFIIPELKGISQKTIEEHIKLYQGYVKHANLILEALNNSPSSLEASQAYAISEMQRRFAFEFDGMRNHEFYFCISSSSLSNMLAVGMSHEKPGISPGCPLNKRSLKP